MSSRFVPGSRIKQYRIGELLGRGGMGEVYAAEDTRLGRRVAIKLLPAAFGSDQDRLRRFMQEARTASALNHPSILTIHDVDDVDGTPLLVSELVEGVTLRERLRSGGLTLTDSLDVAGQIASALAAAHNAGIVHRDVKPENIMLREDGLAKLLDFGVAKLAIDSDSPGSSAETQTAFAHTTPGVVMGTTRYLSPEQARGLPVDGRSDIFSLGAVLYEMVAARPPFDGQTPTDVILAILQHPVEPIDGAPPELDRILQKALDKERGERYQTAKDLVVDLRRLRKQSDGGNASATWRTPRSGSSVPASTATASAGRARVRHAVLAALGLTAIGLALWAGLKWRDAAPAAARPVPITRFLGSEVDPAISPDGKLVAFAWNGESGDNFNIYVRSIDGSAPLPLTNDTAGDFAAAWSPDGQRIAFVRVLEGKGEVIVLPALGGPEQRLFETAAERGGPGRLVGGWSFGLSWTPDGKHLVFSDRSGSASNEAIYLYPFEDGERRQLTHPPANSQRRSPGGFSGRAISRVRSLEPGRHRRQCLSAEARPAESVGGSDATDVWPSRDRVRLGARQPQRHP